MSNAIHALIIDDDPLSVQVLSRMLDNENVTNTHLNDPAHLEQTLDEVGQLDLVFLDLEMPHRDGYEVLDILRQRLGTSVRIIACTVHTSELRSSVDLGFDGFIGKPLDLARFSGQLQRILNGERVWEI